MFPLPRASHFGHWTLPSIPYRSVVVTSADEHRLSFLPLSHAFLCPSFSCSLPLEFHTYLLCQLVVPQSFTMGPTFSTSVAIIVLRRPFLAFTPSCTAHPKTKDHNRPPGTLVTRSRGSRLLPPFEFTSFQLSHSFSNLALVLRLFNS